MASLPNTGSTTTPGMAAASASMPPPARPTIGGNIAALTSIGAQPAGMPSSSQPGASAHVPRSFQPSVPGCTTAEEARGRSPDVQPLPNMLYQMPGSSAGQNVTVPGAAQSSVQTRIKQFDTPHGIVQPKPDSFCNLQQNHRGEAVTYANPVIAPPMTTVSAAPAQNSVSPAEMVSLSKAQYEDMVKQVASCFHRCGVYLFWILNSLSMLECF